MFQSEVIIIINLRPFINPHLFKTYEEFERPPCVLIVACDLTAAVDGVAFVLRIVPQNNSQSAAVPWYVSGGDIACR